ncbi:MAG: tRNA (adenosine(37)-N6)-threonylcarbamoyltransferase complex dimerization subunit type 1 TsaB [Geobacteraceae bacterium]|nr:tRNA (adenosine(37)-N6)-threonylcarbamoyltransferase complex dimerization subunit type 1 TsaB [Geobacteraceae bacterium]
MVNILAIDTSTSLASIAVAVGNTIAAESTFSTDRTLSARLVPEIARLLALAGLTVADIDLFAASTGPGSFTGVRGGIATVQGLALACGKPCVGFSSLTLLALNFPLASFPVCTLMDARKSEVYAALFNCSSTFPSAQISDSVMPPGRLLDMLRARAAAPVIFCGDGAARYQNLIADHMEGQAIFAPFPLNIAHASNAIPLALQALESGKALDPSRLLPVYLRASEAEINRDLAAKSGHPTI